MNPGADSDSDSPRKPSEDERGGPPPLASAEVLLPDADATRALGAALAAHLSAGMQLHLRGGLGSGKTTLSQGLLRSLGATGRIKSPTFSLVEPYNLARFDVYHFDFYRFSSPDEWLDSGFDEIFASDAACLVEWPELAAPHLPVPDLVVCLDHVPPDDAQRGDAQPDPTQTGGSPRVHAGEGHLGEGQLAEGRIARLQAFSERGRACLTHARKMLAGAR